LLDFGQLYDNDGQALIHTRIIATPRSAKTFSTMLQDLVKKYEQTIGPIAERQAESMASANAIPAIGQAIIGLIAGGCAPDEFLNAKLELYQAKDFQTPMREGVSLYLYRITPAGEIRNYPPRIAPDGRKFKQLLPINLHYILSAWAQEAVKQQRLLGWAMR